MLALTLQGEISYLAESEQEDALERYWNARQSGDQTAKLIRLEGEPPEPEDDDPPPTPPGARSEVAQERIRLQEAWLADAGFALPPPLYAPGTRVIALGDQNFRLERQRVENMPRFEDAAQAVREQIYKESRDDIGAPLWKLWMSDMGHLQVRSPEVELGLEHGAFQQLAQLGGFGSGVKYLSRHCDAKLRAENVNYQLMKHMSDDGRFAVLRTRLDDMGERSIYAAVSQSYAAVDTDEVLAAVTPALRDAHVEMTYDGTGVCATALFMPDEVVDFAAGDVFKVGVRIETNDLGRGRIRISGVAFRNLCLNLIVIAEGEVETVSQVHRGDPEQILEVVRTGVEKARASVGSFLEAWGHARTVKLDARAVLKDMVEQRKLELPGIRSKEQRNGVLTDLFAAWEAEPGDTVADVANAMTRAAHATGKYDYLLQAALERQASELILLPR